MESNRPKKKHLAERYATFKVLEREKTLGAKFANFESIFGKRHIRKAYIDGWNACLKHLASMPWDEAMNEIVNYCKEKED